MVPRHKTTMNDSFSDHFTTWLSPPKRLVAELHKIIIFQTNQQTMNSLKANSCLAFVENGMIHFRKQNVQYLIDESSRKLPNTRLWVYKA